MGRLVMGPGAEKLRNRDPITLRGIQSEIRKSPENPVSAWGKNSIFDAFSRKPKREWLSKKRQMQGAQLSRNEAYSGTPQ